MILCRDSYGQEEVIIADGETESVACSKIPKHLEVIDVQEKAEER